MVSIHFKHESGQLNQIMFLIMFLSNSLDYNSSDVIDCVFWSFCKLDADRAPKFVAATITAKNQIPISTARSVTGTSIT